MTSKEIETSVKMVEERIFEALGMCPGIYVDYDDDDEWSVTFDSPSVKGGLCDAASCLYDDEVIPFIEEELPGIIYESYIKNAKKPEYVYTVALSGDMYDSESWTKVKTGRSLVEVVEWANEVIDDFAEETGTEKIEHDYGDEIDGKCLQTVYHRLTIDDVMDSECYCHHLVFEDDNTNRIFALIVKTELK